jgi:hypothetical protein
MKNKKEKIIIVFLIVFVLGSFCPDTILNIKAEDENPGGPIGILDLSIGRDPTQGTDDQVWFCGDGIYAAGEYEGEANIIFLPMDSDTRIDSGSWWAFLRIGTVYIIDLEDDGGLQYGPYTQNKPDDIVDYHNSEYIGRGVYDWEIEVYAHYWMSDKVSGAWIPRNFPVTLYDQDDGNLVVTTNTIQLIVSPSQNLTTQQSGSFEADIQNSSFFNGIPQDDLDEVTYYWEFGDGANSTEQNPSHSYSNSGTYFVTLVCEDLYENEGDGAIKITVA